MTLKPFWITTLATLACLAPTMAGAESARSSELNGTWQEQFTIAKRANVRVTADDAHVYLHTAGDARSVDVKVVYELKKWGMVWGARKPSVKFEHEGDVIFVSVRDPNMVVAMGGIVEKLEIHITLPAASDVSVRTGDGHVESEPLTGKVQIETGDGNLTLHGLRGDIFLRTGDGRIVADGLDGNVHAHSGDGLVRIGGRFDVLSVHTGDGRVEATAAPGSKLSKAWDLETGDGPLLLRVPVDLKAFLDVETGDGRIHVELPIEARGTQRGHTLRGELNGGGAVLRMRTADGPITLGLTP